MPVFEWFNFMRDLLQDMSLHIRMNIEPSDDSLNWIGYSISRENASWNNSLTTLNSFSPSGFTVITSELLR